MTHQERQSIATEWLVLAEMFGKSITPQVVSRMIDAVDDLSYPSVRRALQDWPKVAKFERHPLPAEVRSMASPAASDDAIAKEAAARLIQAISRCGWNNSGEAREFMGELAWGVVKRLGGWLYVCENVGNEMAITTLMAQARDLCKSQMELAKAGRLGEAPGLPEPTNKFKIEDLVNIKTIGHAPQEKK